MKKKTFAMLALLFVSAVFTNLSFGFAINDSEMSVEGVLQWYGNAPFERLCLKSRDEKLYYLDMSREERDSLSALTGYNVRLEGTLSDELPPVEVRCAMVLKVEKWKKL